jgi:hypothetical protein
MLAAEATKLLIVGVSKYTQASLNLEFPRFNAEELRSALLNKEGCAIPEDNLALLCDEDASRAKILQHLQTLAKNCTVEDVLIFYFSGHGEQANDAFYLLGYDATADDLANSAVSTADLQSALSACVARGVLVILDCCKSAGFAEHAEQFFRTLSNQEFRLMFSASRAGQLSYEFRNARGTLFSRALINVASGQISSGQTVGLVYFSDLFDAVQREVAEGLETLGHDASSQEPIFAGTYAKDPLIFILKRQSLERIEAEAPRYSRRFVRRRIRRVIATIVGLLIAALLGYYYYLDHSRYIWHEPGTVAGFEGDYLSIYAGDPKYNWLGFPHRIMTTDVRAEALSDSVRPGIGSPIRCYISRDITAVLTDQLSPEWKVCASVWNSSFDEARESAKSIDLADEPNASGQKEAAEALASIATSADKAMLDDLVEPEADSSSRFALRALASFDPHHAIDVAEDMGTQKIGFLSAILAGFPKGCDADIRTFIGDLAARCEEDHDPHVHGAWFGALLRTGCVLPSSAIFKVVDSTTKELPRGLDWIPILESSKPQNFDRDLTDELQHNITAAGESQPLDNKASDLSVTLWTELIIAATLAPQSVPDSTLSLLVFPEKHVRLAAARALVAKDKRNEALLVGTYAGDPWILSALVEAGWYDDQVARHTMLPTAAESRPEVFHFYSASVMFFLRALRRHHVVEAAPLVEELLECQQTEIQIEALRTLDSFAPTTTDGRKISTLASRLDSTHYSFHDNARYVLLRGSYIWLLQHNQAAFDTAIGELGDNVGDAAGILGRIPLSADVVAAIRQRLPNQSDSLKAAAILAMRGTREDLYELLSSSDCNLRRVALLYAPYNSAVDSVLDKSSAFGTCTQWYLRYQRKLKTQIEKEMNEVPIKTRGIACGILRDKMDDLSPGLSLWLGDQIDSLESTELPSPDEIDLDNSPPPLSVK